MEINTTNLRTWELDSRTAAFHQNKRPHDLTICDDHSSSGSTDSTPRKRARRIGKLGRQDVRDFVPVGASFSSTPIPLDEQVPSEDEGMHVGPSLGGEGLQNYDTNQDLAAQIPQDVHNGITASEYGRPGSPIPGDTKVSITEDQILPNHDYSTKEGPTNGGVISKNEHALAAAKDIDGKFRHKIGNSRESTNSTIAPITWNPVNSIKIRTRLGGSPHKEAVDQVEQGSKDKASAETQETATQVAFQRLEGLRHRLSTLDPHDGPVSAYKAAESELHDAEVDYNYCLYYPINEDFIRPPTKAKRQIAITTQEKQVELWDSVENYMKKGRPLEDIRDGRIVDRSSNTPSSTHHDKQEHSTSDGGLMLNLEDAPSGYSGPSILDPDGRTPMFEQILQSDLEESGNDFTDNSESESESKNASTDSEASSEDVDEMIEYSNSEQVPKYESHQAQANIAISNRNARILADLNPQQLNAQLRYFHITKTLQEVDRSMPVRCLVCAQHGHMSEACELLTCTACGAYNRHITQSCPKLAKCSKCREPGHGRLDCPYKLKNIAQAEIICDLCQRTGHTEEDCELLWRTSGRPWDSNLTHGNLRLSCYECGRLGHLGNGCPTRRPEKLPGTSSWGVSKGQMLNKSGDGISIKGRARHDPIDVDESEDELAEFHRPKVPKPGPKGKIQIKTALISPMLSQPPNIQWNPINEPNRDIRATETRRPQYENDGPGNWHSTRRSGYDSPQESNYRASYQRSHSPEPRDRLRDHRIDRYRPAEPREERHPVRNAPLYRPMPSAARNQWNRHRL